MICADERKPRLVLVCSEEMNWFTKLVKTVGQYMTIVTITADDDLLSLYGINKVRACLRDENAVMFFAGPCTGGSSWARLNKTRSVATEMLVRRTQIMFCKLFDVFAHLMERRTHVKFKSLFELPRHCDYWKDPRMAKVIDAPDSHINDFDGCCYGLREQFSHPPKYIKKPWRIVSWGVDFGESLSKKCDGRHEHAPCAGRETLVTQVYTSDSNIVSTILKKLNEEIDQERIVLSDGESRRSRLKVRARGNKSKATCVVVLCVIRDSDHPNKQPLRPQRAQICDTDFHISLIVDPASFRLPLGSNHCGCWPFGETKPAFFCSTLCGCWPSGEKELSFKDPGRHKIKMAMSARSPQPVEPILPGSGGGTVDLFLSHEDSSVAKRSLAVIATMYQTGAQLPMFRLNIDMDLSHAMIWCQNDRLPIVTAISFWFMTGEIETRDLVCGCSTCIDGHANKTARGPCPSI